MAAGIMRIARLFGTSTTPTSRASQQPSTEPPTRFLFAGRRLTRRALRALTSLLKSLWRISGVSADRLRRLPARLYRSDDEALPQRAAAPGEREIAGQSARTAPIRREAGSARHCRHCRFAGDEPA